MWHFLYSFSISLYLIGNYPEWREGVFTLAYDASSLWRWLSARRHMGTWHAPVSIKNRQGTDHNSTAIWMPPGSSEIKLRTKALFALGPVASQPYGTYQGSQIYSQLRETTLVVPISPDLCMAAVLNTPATFAKNVRDFVSLKCSEYSGDKRSHRFFVFHPDTAWMGAFQRLGENEGPLPLEFAGVSHNLFVLARWMLCERVALVQALGDAGREISFHLLVPAAEPLVIPQPFSFVDALEPLTIEGPISRGQPLVWFRMAAASRVQLRDVGVIPPPCLDLAEGKACIAVCLLWIAASPLLLVFCRVVCSVNLPVYVALALSLVLHAFALNGTVWLKKQVREYYMQEDCPMTLG